MVYVVVVAEHYHFLDSAEDFGVCFLVGFVNEAKVVSLLAPKVVKQFVDKLSGCWPIEATIPIVPCLFSILFCCLLYTSDAADE